MNELQIFNDIEQCSDEWFKLRLGIVTASRFADVLAGGKGETRRKYLYDLAGEAITGQPTEERFSNNFSERGKALEAEARNLYAMATGNEPILCGFMRRGAIGCSPDFLVSTNGHGTIKTRMARLQMELLESGVVPSENMAQTQGEMLVSGREFSDFVSYCRGLPPFIKRVPRDVAYQAKLKVALDEFIVDLQRLVAKHRGMQ